MRHTRHGQATLDEEIPAAPCGRELADADPSETARPDQDLRRDKENAAGPYAHSHGHTCIDAVPCDNISHGLAQRSVHAQQVTSDDGALTHQISVDMHGNTYPEGGLRAWLVVYGAFSGMTAGFGLMNTIGTFQAYLSKNQLAHEDPSTVGWVFSLYTFFAFFCGIQIGPIFDAKGPRALVIAGTACLVGGTLGIAESTSMARLSRAPVSSMAQLTHGR